MKLSLLVRLSFVLLCSFMATASIADEKANEAVALESVVLESIVMHSKSLENNPIAINAERELLIVLPPSYQSDPTKNYPVVYLLHGLGASSLGWFSIVEGQPNVQKSLQKLYDSQQISEMILVVPDSYNAFAKGGWYSNSVSGGNWEDYIIKDVIPYIDANYRTNQQRGLAGGSMGGYGAFRLAMKHPSLFGAIYSMSAALADSSGRDSMGDRLTSINEGLQKTKEEWSWDDIYNYSVLLSFAPSDDAPLYIADTITSQQIDLLKANSLDHLLATHLESFKKQTPVIKFDVGTRDHLKHELRLFAKLLEKSGIKASYSEYVGGHSDKLHLLVEHELFQYFSQFFTNTLPDKLPDSLIDVNKEQPGPEPKIVELDAFEITGIEAFGSPFSEKFPQLWDQFYSLNIDRNKQCNNSVSIGFAHWNNRSNGQLYYLVGCQENSDGSLPNTLDKKELIPANKYAVFTYKGSLDKKEIQAFYDYIYGDWLAYSGYEVAGAYNLEFYDDRFSTDSEDSVMTLYVPIRKPVMELESDNNKEKKYAFWIVLIIFLVPIYLVCVLVAVEDKELCKKFIIGGIVVVLIAIAFFLYQFMNTEVVYGKEFIANWHLD